MNTYQVLTKTGTFLIKADNFTVVSSDNILSFHIRATATSVAAFSLNELVGCIQVDHLIVQK
jgi:hypothetical protein